MKVAIVGPVFPYRAGIAYCTTRLAEELARTCDVDVISFSRQYPKRFYPGGDDLDATLRSRTPTNAHFILDVINPFSWLATALTMRREKYDAVILVWWIWVWALPYLTLMLLLSRRTRIILQCHNIGDKEPRWWKRLLTDRVLRRGDVLVVHARTEADDAWRRSRGRRTVITFLPVHELGGAIPTRAEARRELGIEQNHVALFFGHVRPFKGLDIALRAWRQMETDALLLVAGEAWWNRGEEYRALLRELGFSPRSSGDSLWFCIDKAVRLDLRFIPDSEIAAWFAAADVVLAPYRIEAQSGVALTAFHFARPVIATMVGGLPEIIVEGRNGMLVPPEDPAALAAAMDAFFKRVDRSSMEEQAALSAQKYSWAEYGRVFGRLTQS